MNGRILNLSQVSRRLDFPYTTLRRMGADQLDLGRIDLAEQVHDGHGIRQQRAFEVLADDPARDEVGGRRTVPEDGLARLKQELADELGASGVALPD